MSMAKYAESLAELNPISRPDFNIESDPRAAERMGVASQNRSRETLIWIHASEMVQTLSLIELIGRIHDQISDVEFLITTNNPVPPRIMDARMPSFAVHQYLVNDTNRPVERFLDHWNPDLCLWAEDRLAPILFKECQNRSVPMVFVNAGLSSKNVSKLRWVPGLTTELINCFDEILTVSPEATAHFKHLGAKADSLSTCGHLREGTAPLPYIDAERTRLAKQLDGRPVWHASHVCADEIDMVLEAQKIAMRSTHRLLLILSPETLAESEKILKKVKSVKLNVARRSEDDLSSRTDVLLADDPSELGLWYRCAPVSFVGCSLSDDGGSNPFEAAALGSALIHGPNVENFADSYFRLAEAGAALEVPTVPSLAEAVSELMSPDKAAEMAHAAWEVSSEGSEVTDRILEVIVDCLARKGEAA